MSTKNNQKRMTKRSIGKTRKNRTTPTEPESTVRVEALQAKTSSVKRQKRETKESIEMTQRNRSTPENDEQPGRSQAVRDWFGSSFGRKAKG